MSTKRDPVPAWIGPAGGSMMAVWWWLVCAVAHVPLWAPAVFAGVCGGVLGAVTWRKETVTAGLIRVGCWILPAGWGIWTAWRGVEWANAIVLFSLAVPAITLSYALDGRHRAQTLPGAEHPYRRELRELLDELLKIAPPYGFRVTKFTMWPGKAGYTARVEPPIGSAITVKKVREVQEVLEAELQLPAGCTIRIAKAEHAGAFAIEVMLTNALKRDGNYPTRYRQRSIFDPVRCGWYADGSPLELNLFKDSTVAVAMRGGGKTVLMHVMIAELLQCTDELVAVIDMNGAGLAVPWMRPFAIGDVDEPPLILVATGDDQAIEAAAMLVAMAKERKAAFAGLMAELNVDVLPASPEHPHITVIIDEGGEIFGSGDRVTQKQRDAAELFLELQRIGRAVGINVIFTSQRGTADYLPAQLKKATWNKFVGLVQDDDEIAHVLSWKYKLDADDITGAGEWYVQLGHNPPRKAKTFGLLPNQIADIARATQHWRPALDPVTARAGGSVWAQWGVKMQPWLWALTNPDFDPDEAPITDVAALIAGSRQADGDALAEEFLAQQRRIEENVRRMRDLADAEVGEALADAAAGVEPEWAAAVRQQIGEYPVLTGPRNTPPAPPPPPEMTDGEKFLLRLLTDAGDKGMTTGQLFNAAKDTGLTNRRPTVTEWATKLVNKSLVTKRQTGVWVVGGQTRDV